MSHSLTSVHEIKKKTTKSRLGLNSDQYFKKHATNTLVPMQSFNFTIRDNAVPYMHIKSIITYSGDNCILKCLC